MALEQALERSKGEAATASDADSTVQSQVRDADIDRQLYFMLASRSKELETETRAQNPNARLVSLADVPTRPSFPQTIPFFSAAALLGGICGLAAASYATTPTRPCATSTTSSTTSRSRSWRASRRSGA